MVGWRISAPAGRMAALRRNRGGHISAALDLRNRAIAQTLGFCPFHSGPPALFLHKALLFLGKRLGWLIRGLCGLPLDVGVLCLDGQPVRRLLAVGRRFCRPMGKVSVRDDIPRLDLQRFRSSPWDRFYIHRKIADSRLPYPDLGRLRSGLPHGRHIRVGIMNSRLSGFDPSLPHPLLWGRLCPTTFRRPSTGATFPGGNSFPRLDPGLFPWGRLMGGGPLRWGLRERRQICRRLRRGRI